MKFEVLIKRSALKVVMGLDKEYRERILEAVYMLKREPIPARRYDVKKLRGYKDTYRIRVGRLRIVYEIKWLEKKILIHFVGWRGQAYK